MFQYSSGGAYQLVSWDAWPKWNTLLTLRTNILIFITSEFSTMVHTKFLRSYHYTCTHYMSCFCVFIIIVIIIIGVVVLLLLILLLLLLLSLLILFLLLLLLILLLLFIGVFGIIVVVVFVYGFILISLQGHCPSLFLLVEQVWSWNLWKHKIKLWTFKPYSFSFLSSPFCLSFFLFWTTQSYLRISYFIWCSSIIWIIRPLLGLKENCS